MSTFLGVTILLMPFLIYGIIDYLNHGQAWHATPTEAEAIREALDAEFDALERARDFELWEAQL